MMLNERYEDYTVGSYEGQLDSKMLKKKYTVPN